MRMPPVTPSMIGYVPAVVVIVPRRVDRMEGRGVKEDGRSSIGERLNVEDGSGGSSRAVRVRDSGVSRGQGHELVRSLELGGGGG